MADVFLSFDDPEDRRQAREIAGVLEAEGWTVWACWEPMIGHWTAWVRRELRKAGCVVVLWSYTSVHKRMVEEEAMEGDRRNCLVSVVLYPRVEVPVFLRLHDHARYFESDGKQQLKDRVTLVLRGDLPVTPSGSTIKQAELDRRSELHAQWLQGWAGERLRLPGCDLRGLDFRGASLGGADFKGSDLRSTKGLVSGQLAGTNLTEAKVDEAIDKGFTESLAQEAAKKKWLLRGLGSLGISCVFGVLLLFYSDREIHFGQELIKLPGIDVGVRPYLAFIAAGPVIAALYLWVQKQLLDIGRIYDSLPAVSTDGKPLRERVDISPLGLFLAGEQETGQRDGGGIGLLTRLARVAWTFLLWPLGPLVILLIWARSLVLHSLSLSSILGVLAALTAFLGWRGHRVFLSLVRQRGNAGATRMGPQLTGFVMALVAWVCLSALVVNGQTSGNLPDGVQRSAPSNEYCISTVLLQVPAAMIDATGVFRSWALIDDWQESWEARACEDYERRGRRRDLRYSRWSNVDVNGADLAGISFVCAAFVGQPVLDGARFCESDLSYARLRGSFKSADLRKALMVGTDLSSADLESADLRGANLTSAVVANTNFHCAKLSGAQLAGVQLGTAQRLRCAHRGAPDDLDCNQKQELYEREALIDWLGDANCPKPEVSRALEESIEELDEACSRECPDSF